MIVSEGAYQDGVHYRYSPNNYDWMWEGEYPHMIYGPYNYTHVEGVDFRQASGRRPLGYRDGSFACWGV
eukprot:scaffold1717_cov62-Cyclotella_meneghiniana.AAC.1